MEHAAQLRQGIWDGLSVILLSVLFGLTAMFAMNRFFLFCAIAGVYLVLHFAFEVLADRPAFSWIWLILTAASAVCLVFLSGQLVSFLFLPFSLPAMRNIEKHVVLQLLFRSLLLPVAFVGAAISGLLPVEREDGLILLTLFGVFSLFVFLIERRLILAEGRRRQERLLLEKSVAEAIAEREKRQLLLHHHALDALHARQEEREAMSRSIHNEVGHSITASLVALEAADILMDRDTELARQKIRTACDRMRESLSGIRQAVRVMDANSYIVASELVQRIQTEIHHFSEDTDRIVRFHAELKDENAHVPSEYVEFLSGAVLELLSNGVRHGKASAFVLLLVLDASGLRLTVEDNGQGAGHTDDQKTAGLAIQSDTPGFQAGFGLSKIRSYAEKNGGALMIAPGAGFRVSLDLPVILEGE